MKDQADPRPAGPEAELTYRSGSYEVVRPGTWVTCAVTGRAIAIEDLRYWSFERQEAYVDAAAARIAWARHSTLA